MTTPEAPASAWLDLDALRHELLVVEVGPEGGPTDRLERIRLGVAEFVERNRADLWAPTASAPDREFVPTAGVLQGAFLLAARLVARRGAPLGVQSYGEFAASILRSDPDIGLMLGLGRNAKPALG